MKKIISLAVMAAFASMLLSCEKTDKGVDMGLSVNWSDRNLDATSESDTGNFYGRGTEGFFRREKVEISQDINTKNIAGTNLDPVHKKLGGKWRMPTIAEFKELFEKCKSTFDTVNNMVGIRFTAANGNNIFIPFTGEYYVSLDNNSLGTDGYYMVADHDFTRDANTETPIKFGISNDSLPSMEVWGITSGMFGLTVRPVYDENIKE